MGIIVQSDLPQNNVVSKYVGSLFEYFSIHGFTYLITSHVECVGGGVNANSRCTAQLFFGEILLADTRFLYHPVIPLTAILSTILSSFCAKTMKLPMSMAGGVMTSQASKPL